MAPAMPHLPLYSTLYYYQGVQIKKGANSVLSGSNENHETPSKYTYIFTILVHLKPSIKMICL